jgi:hypothetical protein
LGGDHPSQTTHLTLSSSSLLVPKQNKGGISTSAPPVLAHLLQSLPPILHILCSETMLNYSKGSWGLFVPLRVIGIFTDTSISPSSWLRQCPNRYTIRAGRNLPDKEFRYLRTVIVTAAVYWGLSQLLSTIYTAVTTFLNLPAPGRCQTLYFNFRFCRVLCFC